MGLGGINAILYLRPLNHRDPRLTDLVSRRLSSCDSPAPLTSEDFISAVLLWQLKFNDWGRTWNGGSVLCVPEFGPFPEGVV